MAPALVLLLVASFASLAFSSLDTPYNRFLNPSNGADDTHNRSLNPIWLLGSEQTIQWTTTAKGPYTVDLWHQDPGRNFAWNLTTIFSTSSGPGLQSAVWRVNSVNADIAFSNLFFFWVRGDDADITSRFLNFTRPASSTTTGLGTPGMSSQTPNTSSSPVDSASQAQAASDTSSTTKLILGVGLGIGIPIVLLVAAGVVLLLLRRRRRQRQENDADDVAETPPAYYEKRKIQDKANVELAAREIPLEVPAAREPAELSGERSG